MGSHPDRLYRIVALRRLGLGLAEIGGLLDASRRWRELIVQLTGGHEGIRRSLGRTSREQGAETASRGMVDPGLMEYVGKALSRLG